MSAWTVAAAATFTPGQVFAQRAADGTVHLWTRGDNAERPWAAPGDVEPRTATDQEIAEAMLVTLHGAGLPLGDVDWAWGLQTRTFVDGPHDSAIETRDARTMRPYTRDGATEMVERMNGERGQFRPDGARVVRQLVGAWAPDPAEPEKPFETPHDSLRYALDWAMWGHGMGDTFRGPLIERMLAGVPVADRAQAQALITDWLARRGPGDSALFTHLRTQVAELEAEVERLREVGMDGLQHLARQMGLTLREERRAREVYLRLASTMTFAETVRHLDITNEELADDVERGNVIALDVGDEQVFPADQFLVGRSELYEILRAVRGDDTGRRRREAWCWTAALFLVAPQPELGGATPTSWLLDGHALTAVLDAARRVEAAGGPIAAAPKRPAGD